MTLKEILSNSPYPEMGIIYEQLPSEEDPVQVSCCGKMTTPNNVLNLYDGGSICLDCFSESVELVKCDWCGCIMSPGDLVRFRDCPACGQPLEGME